MIEHGIERSSPSTVENTRKVSDLDAALQRKDILMKEVRKHLRLSAKPHQSRVKIPSLLDNFNHTRNDQRHPTVRFFTCDRNVPESNKIELKKENPFKPLYSETEEILVKRFPTYSSNKPKAKTKKLNTCEVNPLLERLQVPSEPLPCNIVIDGDPLYFEKPKGRPLKERFKKLDFKQTQRVVFFENLLIGWSYDDVLKRKEHFALDLLKLEETSSELDETKKNLETFITELNTESVQMVRKQLKLGEKRDTIKAILAKRRSVFAMTKNSLYKNESALANALYSRDLLFRLSPSSYQFQYTLESKSYSGIVKKLRQEVLLMYEDFCRYNPETAKDYYLDEAMTTFLNQLSTLGPPKFYFKNHWEIDKFLREIELSCAEMLDGVERLSRINIEIESLGKDVQGYQSRIKSQIANRVGQESFVIAEEQSRVNQLEEVAYRETTEQLKFVTSGDALLETMGLVEFLHQEMFLSSRKTFTTLEMMDNIEKEVFTMENTVRNLDPNKVAYCKKKIRDREHKKKMLADEATRKFNEAKNYMTRMKGLLAKPVATDGIRKLVYKTRVVPSKKVEKSSSKTSSKKKPRKKTVKSGKETFKHLQLHGICEREDIEDIASMMANKLDDPKGSINLEASSRIASGQVILERIESSSSASSDEFEQSLLYSPSVPVDVKKITGDSSFEILELGYDSGEELIRQNRKHPTDTPIPPVLYDAVEIDDNFMCKVNEIGETSKDHRHRHRPLQKVRTHPLSWR